MHLELQETKYRILDAGSQQPHTNYKQLITDYSFIGGNLSVFPTFGLLRLLSLFAEATLM